MPAKDYPFGPFTLTVTENGISNIALGGTTLGSGDDGLHSSSVFTTAWNNQFLLAPVKASASLGVTAATVTRHYDSDIEMMKARVVTKYDFRKPPHIGLQWTVTNIGTRRIDSIGFRTPRFGTASAKPWSPHALSPSNTQGRFSDFGYPSYHVPIGAAYVADERISASLCPHHDLRVPSLIHAAGEYNTLGHRLIWVLHADDGLIEPGGTRIFSATLLLTTLPDWQHLLGPHKMYLERQHGGIRYVPDNRPWGQFAHLDRTQVRPDNPLGYHAGRRFDIAQEAAKYAREKGDALRQGGFAGMIFWQPQGIHPRGVQYRPDFDCFPPEVASNWTNMTAEFRSRNLRVGLCSRPGECVTPDGWDRDGYYTVRGHDKGYLDRLASRYRAMAATGVDAYYVDTFPHRANCVRHLAYMRERADATPRSVNLYTEHGCDASLYYAGRYAEVGYDAASGEYRVSEAHLPILRWLVPDADWVLKPKSFPQGDIRETFPAFARWAMQNRYSFFVEDYMLPGMCPLLRPLVDEFVDPVSRRWR